MKITPPMNDGDKAWNLWLQHKSDLKAPYSEGTAALAVLRGLRREWGDNEFRRAVLFSVSNNYKGLIKCPKKAETLQGQVESLKDMIGKEPS